MIITLEGGAARTAADSPDGWARIEPGSLTEVAGAAGEGPWKLLVTLDGRGMALTVALDPDTPVCGVTQAPRRWVCRLWKGHDGPHLPFSDGSSLLDLVVTAMASAV